MAETIPTFEIFRGTLSTANVKWLESAEGLAAARDRMNQIASEEPGPYFVFSISLRVSVAAVDTTPGGIPNSSNAGVA
jgi:hypothetical protein